MSDFINRGNFNSDKALMKYWKMKNPLSRSAAWAREFHKNQQKQRAEEAEHYPAPQVGFGSQYSHTFKGDAEDDSGSNLDYNA